MLDMVEGEEGPWIVTRHPRDMKGCIGRMADRLLERLGLTWAAVGASA